MSDEPVASAPIPPDYIEPLAAGMVQPGNLDPHNRSVLQNEDGSYSTTSSISIGTDDGETLIPTVVNGQRLSEEDAIAHFRQTGEHFGIFKTPEAADAFAVQMHNDQAARGREHGGSSLPDDPLTRARMAGYSWPEIRDHIAAATAAAISFGYTEPEIDAHLGYKPAPTSDYRNSWVGALALDPMLGASIADGDLDLTANPKFRSDYARAVYDNSTRGPADFARDYASAALEVGATGGESLDVAAGLRAAASFEADAASHLLPPPTDFTDAALALRNENPAVDFSWIKDGLLNHWLSTGQEPGKAAMQAEGDSALAEKLTAPPPTDSLAALREKMTPAQFQAFMDLTSPNTSPAWYERAMSGAADMVSGGVRLLEHISPGDPAAAFKTLNDHLGLGISTLATQPGYIDQVAAQRLQELRASGVPDDDIARIGGQMVATIPLASTLGLSGAWAWIAAGATGAAAMAALNPGTAEDYWNAKAIEVAEAGVGGAIGGAVLGNGFKLLGRLISKMAPDAADHLAYIIGKSVEPRVPVSDPALPPGTPPRMVPASEAFRPVEPARIETAPEGAAGEAVGTPHATLRFAEDATPASKIERIAQDTEVPANPAPTFFEDAAKAAGVTDPETIALAKGHDAAAGYASWLKTLFTDIMADESGTLRLFPEPRYPRAPSEERPAIIAMKNAASSTIAKVANGLAMRDVNQITQQWEPIRKIFAPHMPEWEAALEKVYSATGIMERNAAIAAAKATEVGRYIQAVEGTGAMSTGSPLYPVVQMRQGIRGLTDEMLHRALASGDLNSLQFRDNYFPHLYDDPGRGLFRSSRGGSVGFTKERSYSDIFEALAEGHHLKYPHPVDTDIAGDTAKLNTLATLRIQAIAKEPSNNWMRYSPSPQEPPEPGWRRIVGLMSEKTAVDANGIATGPTQYLWAPPGFARIYNNHIGYQDYTTASYAFKNFEEGMLRVKNLSTHIKLLLPLYHSVAVYKEGVAAAWGNALIEVGGGLRQGSLGEVMRGLRDAATGLIKPVGYLYRAGQTEAVTGTQGWREMYRGLDHSILASGPGAPLSEPVRALKAFVAGGGNIAGRGAEYQESKFNTLVRDWQRGELGNQFMRDIRSADSVWGGVKLPFKELSRLATSAGAPIWDHYIPLMKAGAAMEKIQTYLRQNPAANEAAVDAYARQVVLQIEDRFGEYNMNNLFWRPGLRRAANQAMLSTSWTYGTLHSLATGMGWNPGRGAEWNPVATADLMGHLATIAATNALWIYAVDGKLPDNKLDLMIPFANARGITRVLLPGQEKEFYDLAKIGAETYSAYLDGGVFAGVHSFIMSTFNYGFGKLAPYIQAAYDLANRAGENAIGDKIGYQPGGFMRWVGDEFLPIFLQNWDKAKAAGISPVQNLFGIREAPKWMVDFEAFRDMEAKLHGRWSKAEIQRDGKQALASGEEPPTGYTPPRVSGGGAARSTQPGAGSGRASGSAVRAAAPQQGYAPGALYQQQGAYADQAAPQYAPGAVAGGGSAGRASRGTARAAGRPSSLLPRSQRRVTPLLPRSQRQRAR